MKMKKTLISVILATYLLLISCGEKNPDQSKETTEESIVSVEESSAVDEEKPFYIDTYEIRETENGTDVLLFTENAYKELKSFDVESFTYEMLQEIVDDTIELYENNETITIQLKEGAEIEDNIQSQKLQSFYSWIVKITHPEDGEFFYAFGDFNTWYKALGFAKGDPKRFSDSEKMVFKTGKNKEAMDNGDKMVLGEIITLRLWYATGSYYSYFSEGSGLAGGKTIISLSRDVVEKNSTNVNAISFNNLKSHCFIPKGERPLSYSKMPLIPSWINDRELLEDDYLVSENIAP